MHYKNGREAKNGDMLLSLMYPQAPMVGILYGAKPEAGSDCNGMLAPVTPSAEWNQYADLKNCLHIDDIAAASIPSIVAPPVDNAHVAEGCEKFAEPTKS
jgi:hypothetical protein